MNQVCILSTAGDTPAHLVHEVIVRKGHAVRWFNGPDFPSRLELFLAHDGEGCASGFDQGGETTAGDCVSVWVRRAVDLSNYPSWYAALAPTEADQARRECVSLRNNFLSLFAPQALWVNPWHARLMAQNKAVQMQAARHCGFTLPPTLMSNSPQRIRAFLRAHAGQAIYKTFNPTGLMTRRIAEADLPEDEDRIRVSPGIFQVQVAKAHELRVTVVGERLFAFRIDSQATQRGQLDFRNAYDEIGVAAIRLPDAIEARCKALCRSLGLVYGALDLIVTPGGDYVFLEVNESGQFTFLEDMATAQGHPAHGIVDAVAELLIQGRADFAWDASRARLWGADDEVFEAACRRRTVAMREHLIPPDGEPKHDVLTSRLRLNRQLSARRAARAADAPTHAS